jgi:hypothetical protein
MTNTQVVAVSLCAAVLAAVMPAAELPVRTVVLYKHGVGYFEREGALAPGESARLDFKAAEMNDVLKSLTVNDQAGRITGLRYDSSIPLDQKLTNFPFQIDDGQPLSAVIDQLKGARIEMEFGAQRMAGAVVSARLIAGGNDHAEREQLTLLMDTGELRNVDLGAASAIRFTDATLQTLFRDYLAALTGSRSKEQRSVYIDSTETKARTVRAEYIVPMPAWKSSYRLLFGDNGQPTLEGWAIVDNTTGEDWNNVRLSLVSGKPISFISQLYEPKFIRRPDGALPEDQAVAPAVYAGAIETDSVRKAPAAGLPLNGRTVPGEGGGAGGGVFRAAAVPPPAPMAQPSGISRPGPAQEIADLFEYSIAAPVTVRRDESVMLPFLQQKIAARKLVIYSDASRPNPFNAAELTNNTGKTLDGGPVTVYDAGTYAGEALVETVKSGDKRFIGYGVDLGTRISTDLNSRSDAVRELHAHNGLLIARAAVVDKKTYSVKNVDARAKTLIVEHPVRPGYSLIDTAKPLETARGVYRFEIALPAGAAVDFPVTEERVYDTQTSVSSLNSPALLAYVRNKTLGDAARRQLQQIAALKTQIVDLDAEQHSVTGEIESTTRDEERNRQNIASLSSVSGQQQTVQDYARRLTDQETQIAKLRDRQMAIDGQRAGLQARLDGMVAALDF